jgi:uncharacterized protein (TIGR02145 family)
MTKKNLIFYSIIITILSLISCGLLSSEKELKIGTQVWTTENLNVSKFRNGDSIPEVKTHEEWIKAIKNKQPAWCYCANDPANGKLYGKLYNFYSVIDSRGLAPAGWHIPSDNEWTTLIDFLGTVPGKKMKSTSGWTKGSGTNESGFSALPGGCVDINGSLGGTHELPVK